VVDDFEDRPRLLRLGAAKRESLRSPKRLAACKRRRIPFALGGSPCLRWFDAFQSSHRSSWGSTAQMPPSGPRCRAPLSEVPRFPTVPCEAIMGQPSRRIDRGDSTRHPCLPSAAQPTDRYLCPDCLEPGECSTKGN